MGITITDHSLILNAIETEVKKRIEEAIKKQVETAVQKVDEEVRKEIGNLALSLLRYYSIERDGQNLIIRVNNSVKGE